MKVLILGCGPAGLFAAHASSMLGHDTIIVSKARKSQMYGAQYLHGPLPIPGRVDAFSSFDVSYELRGSVSAYREKVYGRDYDGTVSPEDLPESHRGWDIRQAYDWMWETYGSYVYDEPDLRSIGRVSAVMDWAKPDLAISTVPAPVLCHEPSHVFRSQKIWSSGKDDQLWEIPENTVICNGEDSPAWYRAANIQGYKTVEWSDNRKPPIPNLHHVEKPISTNCACRPEIHRLGRYGQWKKGVLSHSSFLDTADLLEAPQQMAMDL